MEAVSTRGGGYGWEGSRTGMAAGRGWQQEWVPRGGKGGVMDNKTAPNRASGNGGG